MNRLKYKGFIGSVNFSEADGVFFGKIEGIDGLVNFEGASIKELTNAFHEAVDDYLLFCEDNGIKPKKSYTGTLNIRISPATHNSIADFAAAEGISINTFIRKALEKAVEDPAKVMEPSSNSYKTIEEKSEELKEPAATYGSKDITEFWIPSEDVPLAKAIAKKMGWEFLVNFPKAGLEMALDDIREGRVKEYDSVEQMMKEIEEEDE